MTFYRINDTADFGIAPEGAALIDLASEAPFRYLALTPAAIDKVLRQHSDRFNGGRRADLRGADLRGADLIEADLSGADLIEADLSGAYLSGAYLSGADLSVADLRGAYLHGAYLRGADLRGADLRGADLRGADLRGADLRGAYLRGAYLHGANMTGANMTGAYLSGADLSVAVGIVTAEEEAANIAAAVASIAAEPHNWDQTAWHGGGYLADKAPAVGSCGTAHCLAGWLQAGLPLGDPRRELDAESCGWAMAPRVAAAGWFGMTAHPDLQAMVDEAIAKRNAPPA